MTTVMAAESCYAITGINQHIFK